ncbi:MAG TPA: hypothetical protein VKE24_11905 [Candidatus Acidoferrales bacterium]|nr:hypothetical protein [Candidatus Acidoferrales bacterium]
MRFWPFASALATGLVLAVQPLALPAQSPEAPKRVNETMLAGLRPGKDTLAEAEKRFGSKLRIKTVDRDTSAEWLDECWGHKVHLEFDEKRVIRSVIVSLLGVQSGDCRDTRHVGPLVIGKLKTGRGLALKEAKDRVIGLYGEPNSSGPSTQAGRELESLFYAFDWAGSDVPQVMEVSCDRSTGRAVQIKLALASL